MSNSWEFHHPTQIIFGPGRIDEISSVINGKNVLLITTPGTTGRGLTDQIRAGLHREEVTIFDEVDDLPEITMTAQQAKTFRSDPIDTIVAVGGGSALDTGKLWSVLCHPKSNNFDLEEHLAGNQPFPKIDPIPLVTVPTTAGSGAEVTPFGSVWDRSIPKKYSLSDPRLYPATTIVDPELCETLPLEITVAGALDALSQCLESMWNKHARPLTDSLAADGVKLIRKALPLLYADFDGEKILSEQRSQLSEAALRSGICISQTHTAICHSISYPLTAHYGMPHGLACGITLPAVWKRNARENSERMDEIARQIGFSAADEALEMLITMLERIEMKRWYSQYIANVDELLSLIDEMFTPERAGNNIVQIEGTELRDILIETHECWTDQS